MESYIVRIYRRDEENPQKLTGLVEVAGADERKRFNSLDELCAIMTPVKKRRRRQMKHKTKVEV